MRERFKRLRGYTQEVLEIAALKNEQFWSQEKGIPELCVEFYDGNYTVLEGGEPVDGKAVTKSALEAWLIYRDKLAENHAFHEDWDRVQGKRHTAVAAWAWRGGHGRLRTNTPNTVTNDLWT